MESDLSPDMNLPLGHAYNGRTKVSSINCMLFKYNQTLSQYMRVSSIFQYPGRVLANFRLRLKSVNMISGTFTAWFSFHNYHTVKMTKPTQILYVISIRENFVHYKRARGVFRATISTIQSSGILTQGVFTNDRMHLSLKCGQEQKWMPKSIPHLHLSGCPESGLACEAHGCRTESCFKERVKKLLAHDGID
ncbi:hypothetical protein VNO77_03950 [Canavalia gladiata]|uniref:Uncharacterized protein n=1 Tax=Canavalia gladiata TaxID=3824 RepID=A0AAN9R7A9_CANGL